MEFVLDFNIPPGDFRLKHGDGIILHGSCFSDEMLSYFKNAGHHAVGNHYGTVFHPTILAHNILKLYEDETDHRIFQRADLFFSWNASSSIFGYTKNSLVNRLDSVRSNLKRQLETAKVLIITFGTSWGYELLETQELVANCHKMPASMFQKVLSTPYEMTQDWLLAIDKLIEINPELQLVFTVSPVRHIRDGIVENNLSKARLIEVVQRLALEENVHYFPSYELIIDVLRDYRFFKSDMVHPNVEALKFVWQKFEIAYFSEETRTLNQKISELRSSMQHQSLFLESEAHKKHLKQTQERVEKMKAEYPEVNWD